MRGLLKFNDRKNKNIDYEIQQAGKLSVTKSPF